MAHNTRYFQASRQRQRKLAKRLLKAMYAEGMEGRLVRNSFRTLIEYDEPRRKGGNASDITQYQIAID